MMFALRGIAVSLAFFVLLYCFLSVLTVLLWRGLRYLPIATEHGVANLLFVARLFPLAMASLLTLLVVVPSFDILEPRSVDEPVGRLPLLLGVCALLLLAAGVWRVATTLKSASRMIANWLEDASPLLSAASTPVLRAKREAPPVTLVGIRRPQVLVSEPAAAVLSPDELHIALKHEFAHMRSYDNVKKLIFRFAPCPGMKKLETAWSCAAELSADTAAVTSAADAVELASALVKLSRLLPAAVPPACTVGFVTGSVETRVSRLLAWKAGRSATASHHRSYATVAMAIVVCASALCYGPALTLTHEITEWLVR